MAEKKTKTYYVFEVLPPGSTVRKCLYAKRGGDCDGFIRPGQKHYVVRKEGGKVVARFCSIECRDDFVEKFLRN